jgi:sugar (pentulose or hexulose) kinase
MTAPPDVVIGLDMGTGGARALAVTLDGQVVATGRAAIPPSACFTNGPRVEQQPDAWWQAAVDSLQAATAELPNGAAVRGISVDATSGTFLLLGEDGEPLTPGIMYNDMRAANQTPIAAAALAAELAPFGIHIAAGFALPKILWIVQRQADVWKRCRRIIHQTDWIVGKLCGRFDVTDVSTGLKCGANPETLRWSHAIETQLGIPTNHLPAIVLPGTPIGELTREAAVQTGLPLRTPVIAGCTDGTAGFLASGARDAGDVNVTLGSTLVFKAVAEQPLVDPAGAIYNHRHPSGGYLPGAASSTGGEWINRHLNDEDLDALGKAAAKTLPSPHLAYPLIRQGERFPFAASHATGFGLRDIADPAERFAAGMEGTAFLERLGLARFAALGLPASDRIYATGGAVAGQTWLRIRAAVTRRTIVIPQQTECAMGAAILAAAPTVGGVANAMRAMVRTAELIEPDVSLADAYEPRYEAFCGALRERGYL